MKCREEEKKDKRELLPKTAEMYQLERQDTSSPVKRSFTMRVRASDLSSLLLSSHLITSPASGMHQTLAGAAESC